MNLLLAEAKRLLARRFTWIMLLITAGILGLVVLGVGLSSHRPTPDTVARAERNAQEQRVAMEQMLADCKLHREAGGAGEPGLPPDVSCEQAFDPSQVRTEDFMPHTFVFHDEVPTLVQVLGGVIALFGFAVGASFVGAEWNSGGMMNLLLWRPRRIPVLLTKLGTALAGVLAIGAAVGVGYLATLWGVAAVRGRSGTLDPSFWQSLGLTSVRALALALAATVIGFALASLGRHTATALGVGVGYLIVGEAGASIVLALADVSRQERYVLSSYVTAWLNNGMTYYDYPQCAPNEECRPEIWRLDLGDAATVGGGILVVLLALAVVQMARRDVT